MLSYRERIDGCKDLTPEQWNALHRKQSKPRNESRVEMIHRLRCEHLATNPPPIGVRGPKRTEGTR